MRQRYEWCAGAGALRLRATASVAVNISLGQNRARAESPRPIHLDWQVLIGFVQAMQVSASATRLETLTTKIARTSSFSDKNPERCWSALTLKFKLVSGMNFRDFPQTGSSAARRPAGVA